MSYTPIYGFETNWEQMYYDLLEKFEKLIDTMGVSYEDMFPEEEE